MSPGTTNTGLGGSLEQRWCGCRIRNINITSQLGQNKQKNMFYIEHEM